MRMLMIALSVGMLAGCSGDWPDLAGPSDHPDRIRVAGVPFYPQEGFRCGPAAMAMVLNWSGVEVKPLALEGQFYAVRDPRPALIDAANHYGRLAYPISGTALLTRELAAGHPVVVVQNLGIEREPLWNCVVAMGYDRGRHEMLVHSGDQPAKRMSLRLFERLWADTDQWALVVLKPGELPAAARQSDYLAASQGLQRAGRYWEAVLAYDAALATWPDDADSLMGLGASLYLLGDRQGAADAYRAATAIAGDIGPARDALDHIVAEQSLSDLAEQPPQPRPASGRRAVREVLN